MDHQAGEQLLEAHFVLYETRSSREEPFMPRYLTQDWLDEMCSMAEAQPDRPNASARIQYHVTGAPEGDIDYYWIYENGRIAEAKCGELSDPDFTVTLSYEDSSKIQQGELEPNAAFMQGRMKVTGQLAKMMALMPITSSSEYKALQEKLRTITTY